MINLIGLPLKLAEIELKKADIPYTVSEITPPKGKRNVGSLRVVRFLSDTGVLQVSEFIDTIEEVQSND